VSPLPLLRRLNSGDCVVTPVIVIGTESANKLELKLNFWEEKVIKDVPELNDIAPVEVNVI
jgi:hypothetical protein